MISCAPDSCAAATTWASSASLSPSRTLRSEEHTSELQSRENLVCRLLLEKKKKRAASKRAPTPPSTWAVVKAEMAHAANHPTSGFILTAAPNATKDGKVGWIGEAGQGARC